MVMDYAFLFSGQGSQYPGMGKELYDNFSNVKRIYEEASDIFGFDVAALSFGGSGQDILIAAQPLIHTMSLAALTAAGELGAVPAAAAGFSLGEYAALVCAGVITVRESFRLVRIRTEAMRKAAEKQDGAMFAITGCDAEKIALVCKNTPGYVVTANFNSTVQTVISGETAAASAAAAHLESSGARVTKLAVSAAYHSELMRPAADEFGKAAGNITPDPFKMPFYSNVTGCRLESFDCFRDYLCRHIVSPVLFAGELDAMWRDGYTRFVELGPGRVLSGFVKRTLKGAVIHNVENVGSLRATLKAVGL